MVNRHWHNRCSISCVIFKPLINFVNRPKIKINYLEQPDCNYEPLYEAIKQCGEVWWHYMGSVWIIRTNLTPSDRFDRLHPNIDANDYLFLVDITNQARQGWLPKDAWTWLKQHE